MKALEQNNCVRYVLQVHRVLLCLTRNYDAVSHLDISSNSIYDEGATAVGQMLVECQHCVGMRK